MDINEKEISKLVQAVLDEMNGKPTTAKKTTSTAKAKTAATASKTATKKTTKSK